MDITNVVRTPAFVREHPTAGEDGYAYDVSRNTLISLHPPLYSTVGTFIVM
jgi:hypothetical protein